MKEQSLKSLVVLIFTALAWCGFSSAQAATLPPAAAALLNEINQQIFLQTNSGAPNRPLLAALTGARNALDRSPNTNMVNRLGALITVATRLNRTSLSNEFAAEIDAVLDVDYANLAAAGNHAFARLNSVAPGGLRTAAQNKLNRFLSLLSQAQTNPSPLAVARLLRTAARSYNGLNAAITRAENAPPGANVFQANVTATGEGSFLFRPTPATAVAGVLTPGLRNVMITGIQILRHGRTVTTRTISINLPNVPDGTTTYGVGAPSVGVFYLTATATAQFPPPPPTGDAYNADSGSVTITLNSTTKVAFGTFSFNGNGQNNAGATANVSTGSFLVRLQ